MGPLNTLKDAQDRQQTTFLASQVRLPKFDRSRQWRSGIIHSFILAIRVFRGQIDETFS